jgi:predicted nucleic acid-binding protein
MIEFFDSTVLIAAMHEDENRHDACAQALDSAIGAYAALYSA